MLYHLSLYCQQFMPALNIVHYISFRAMAALLTALFFSLLFGSHFIMVSKELFRSGNREYLPKTHEHKGTLPTMGGLFILATVIVTVLLWGKLTQPHVWIVLITLVLFGAIGFWDDWNKIRHRRGINALQKSLAQVASALVVTGTWIWFLAPDTSVWFPFFKKLHPDLGLLFIPWAMVVMIGSSNAVNLTDGLDGLAIGSLITTFGTYAAIAYATGHYVLATYLHLPYAGCAELSVVASALVGASLGFLWYNTYPAQIFMGDVGSLALGAGLGIIALMTKQELLLTIAGGLFVIETLSVIGQVTSYKLFGKRLFKMAPIHHHFELLGWQEAKIATRCFIISIVLALLSLITLKIR